MTKILILGGLVTLVIGGMTFIPNGTEYLKETIEIEKTVEVDALEVRINSALEAAQASTTALAQEAYDKVLEAEKKRVTDEVKAEYIAEIEATITDPAYWREAHKVKKLIKEAFPDDYHRAVAVATCESGLKPNAYNASNRNGTTDGGVFQLNSTHYPRMEKLGLDPWNVHDNIKFARILYNESGWKPWVCAKNLALI